MNQPQLDPVEAALRTFPLADAPPGLAPGVMARVRQLAPAPRFRLAWLDYALTMLVAAMAGVTFVLWRSIPLTLTQVAEDRFAALLARLGPAVAGALALGGLALIGVAVAAAALPGLSASLTPRRPR